LLTSKPLLLRQTHNVDTNTWRLWTKKLLEQTFIVKKKKSKRGKVNPFSLFPWK
jgi:uncharacterized protein (DUF2344 family)